MQLRFIVRDQPSCVYGLNHVPFSVHGGLFGCSIFFKGMCSGMTSGGLIWRWGIIHVGMCLIRGLSILVEIKLNLSLRLR